VTANLSANSFPRVDWPVGALRVRHRHTRAHPPSKKQKKKEETKLEKKRGQRRNKRLQQGREKPPFSALFSFFFVSSFFFLPFFSGEKKREKMFQGSVEGVRIFPFFSLEIFYQTFIFFSLCH
jgi:hypothetical protein